MADDDSQQLAERSDQEKWQAAHDKLQTLLDDTNAAFDNARTDAQRNALDAIADETSTALTILNRQDIQSNTAALEAAEEPMQSSIDSLNHLKVELAAVAAGFAEAAAVVDGIEEAVDDVSSFFGL